MTRTHYILDSPTGPITLIKTDGVLSNLYMEQHRHALEADEWGTRVQQGFEEETEQLHQYFVHQRTEFTLRLAPEGTPFQQSVWRALQTIPFGHTWSYLQLANALNNPAATRAVGAANGRNPISIIIPCHRVIGASGSLTGYGGGLPNKQFLLAHESPRQTLF